MATTRNDECSCGTKDGYHHYSCDAWTPDPGGSHVPASYRPKAKPKAQVAGDLLSATFACQECGKKFRTVAAARRASFNGCPKCGGCDIDLA